MRKKTEVVREWEAGKFTIRECVDGSYRVLVPRIPKRFYVPSLARLKEDCTSELNEKGRLSGTNETRLAYLGLVLSGERSSVAAKKVLNLPLRPLVSHERIEAAIRAFWPPKAISPHTKHRTPLRRIKEFKKEHPREYLSAKQTHQGLESVMKRMPPPYNTLYNFLGRNAPHKIDQSALGNEILHQLSTGGPISRLALLSCPQDSRERRLMNKILVLGNNRHFSGKREQFARTVSRVSGLGLEYLVPEESIERSFGMQVEDLTEILFCWASIVGLKIKDIDPDTSVCNRYGGRVTFDHGRRGYADLRVGNKAVEVKALQARLSGREVQELIDRYTPKGRFWKSGEPVDSSLVVFHQHPHTYRHAISRLEEAGITVMTYEHFHRSLENLISLMKSEAHQGKITGIFPSFTPDSLLRLHEQVLHPHFWMLERNKHFRQWGSDVLVALRDRARQIRAGEYVPPRTQPTRLEKLVAGKVVSSRYGKFVLAETDFEQFRHEAGKLAEGIDRRERLFSRISERYPQLGIKPSSDAVFLDIETLGLWYTGLVFMAGLTYFDQDRLKISTLIARDPSEERAMLSYLVNRLEKADFVFTYNGDFDLSRITERAKANRLMLDYPLKSLAARLGGRHIDLYEEVKKHKRRLDLPDGRLKTFEEICLNFTRQGDIPGQKVPAAYTMYVYGGSIKNMERIVRHNRLDTVSMLRVVDYLSS